MLNSIWVFAFPVKHNKHQITHSHSTVHNWVYRSYSIATCFSSWSHHQAINYAFKAARSRAGKHFYPTRKCSFRNFIIVCLFGIPDPVLQRRAIDLEEGDWNHNLLHVTTGHSHVTRSAQCVHGDRIMQCYPFGVFVTVGTGNSWFEQTRPVYVVQFLIMRREGR
jgi:hypothetical protein